MKQPTDAQKSAGNYPKGHHYVMGMRISVETPAGAERSGTAPDGTQWKQKLSHDYGYIRGTQGRDKDHIDVFLGPDHNDSTVPVHVVDQLTEDGTFDEHKVMLGFKDAQAASDAYHANYEPGWRGFGDVTALPLGEFKKWAFSEGRRVKPASEHTVATKQVDFSNPEPQRFQLGGAVKAAKRVGNWLTKAEAPVELPKPKFMTDEDAAVFKRLSGLRVDEFEKAQGALGADVVDPGAVDKYLTPRGYADGGAVGGAYFGNPNITRQGRRAGAAPERMSDYTAHHNPVTAAIAGLMGSAPDEMAGSVLDPNRAANLSAAGPAFALGTLAQVLPFVGPAAQGARSLGKHAARAIEGAMYGEGPLSRVLAPAAPAFAVKPKGGNWIEDDLDNYVGTMMPRTPTEGDPVTDWFGTNLKNYIKNHLGTKDDPLLKLEQQGRLHMSPEDVMGISTDYGISSATPVELERARNARPAVQAYAGVPAAGIPPRAAAPAQPAVAGKVALPEDLDRDMEYATAFHKGATGRDYRTPWENLADAQISILNKNIAMRYLKPMGGGDAPEWVSKLPDNTPFYGMNYDSGHDLGFPHVADYLTQATEAGNSVRMLGGDLAELRRRDPGMADLVDRNLHIDPANLKNMSVPDVVGRTSDWNKLLDRARTLEDMNKGVKSVLKDYGPGAHQWVELSPEGLQAEGAAMRHCVGGYCDSVGSGEKRILSLRDAEGRPAVTVELAKATPLSMDKFVGRNAAKYASMPYDEAEPWAAQALKEYNDNLPLEIRQIKGPGNHKPGPEALSYVQDLVRGGVPGLEKWGKVGDFGNTGLNRAADYDEALQEAAKKLGKPDYLTNEELDSIFREQRRPGFADGGMVPQGIAPIAPLTLDGYLGSAGQSGHQSAYGSGSTMNTTPVYANVVGDADGAGPQGGTPGAVGNAGSTLGGVGRAAGVLGSLAGDRSLGQVGGALSVVGGLMNGDFSQAGNMVGRAVSGSPWGGLAGGALGAALSGKAPSPSELGMSALQTAVTAANPAIGLAMSLGRMAHGAWARDQDETNVNEAFREMAQERFREAELGGGYSGGDYSGPGMNGAGDMGPSGSGDNTGGGGAAGGDRGDSGVAHGGVIRANRRHGKTAKILHKGRT